MMIGSLLFPLLATTAAAFTVTPPTMMALGGGAVAGKSGALDSRRGFLGGVAAAASLATFARVTPANAAEDGKLTDVYFGVGCYWHIQHEFVEAERKLLNRDDTSVTSRTGYAGGKQTDKEGRVCYHNFQSVADYGKLGHGEVVGMTIPESSIGDFAKEYFSLFTAKGERVDPMDRGGEYRSLVGFPGGINNPMYSEVEAAAKAKGMTLEAGKGNDPDTLGRKLVYVYDTAKFPFYQAEVYHQFHNDFQSPAYGKKYNDLANLAFEDGRVKTTGCPDRVPNSRRGIIPVSWLGKAGLVMSALVAVTVAFVGLWRRSTCSRQRAAYITCSEQEVTETR